jgi:6-phosphogluconolactonase
MKFLNGPRSQLEKKAEKIITSSLLKTLKTKTKATIGLPGGGSISGIINLLKKTDIPWEKIDIFLVDERKVPIKNNESNFQKIKFLPGNIHPYNYKVPAKEYAKNISFDVILLSAGPDGHVASLFPSHPSIKNKSDSYIEVKNSPKPPRERISASRTLLQKSEIAILLFFGKEKKEAYNLFTNPNITTIQCPAKLVKKIKRSYVLVDFSL